MNQPDLSTQVGHLRQLGTDFGDLRHQILYLDVASDHPALHTLSTLFYRAQGLAARLTAQVSYLDGSPYVQVPGSRESLDALRAAIGTASVAAADLAHALAANPLYGTSFSGPGTNDAQFHEQQRMEAAPVLAEHLQESALQLDLCSTVCHYVAHGIARDTAPEAAAVALPSPVKLNSEQYEALAALAKGGARLGVRARSVHIATVDDTPVTTATFKCLDELGLIRHDISVPLAQGRDVMVTEDGHRALAHRPQVAPPGPVAAPGPTTASSRSSRR
ncbi:hypothetical protein [Streptomyces anulatus]|uniref:hypothetical protein n=1 Tax=Streptomyces anulatus TaxID=1892 RepID=UPI003430C0FD